MIVFPIGDSPNQPKIPWVTWTLIALNVMVHIALWPSSLRVADQGDPVLGEYLQTLAVERQARLDPRTVSRLDLIHYEYGSRPRDLSPVNMFTSMFLHGGLLHLLGNMLFLWVFGDNVEHRLGTAGFVLVYLGTGFAAAFGDTLLRMGSAIPSVGASGAISGVLGLYFAWFPDNRVRMWGFFFPIFIGTFELSARFVLGMYLVVDNILPLLLSGGGGGISYGAHIGGFLAGWALAGPLGRPAPRREEPWPTPAQPTPDAPSTAEAFRRAVSGGDLQSACYILFQLPRRQTALALTIGDKTALGEALERAGETRLALAAYQRALGDHPDDFDRGGAHLGAARVLLRDSPTAAAQHLYAVLEEGATPSQEARARELLRRLD